jgi:hypothetical protein
MELIPIIKQALFVVTILFVVTVAVSYIASKFKKPKKEVPPLTMKPKVTGDKTITKATSGTKTATKTKTSVTVSKTETSESKSEKVNPAKIELPPNVVRKKSSRRRERKKSTPKPAPANKKSKEPRFEVVKDLKKAGKKYSNGNNDIEFR